MQDKRETKQELDLVQVEQVAGGVVSYIKRLCPYCQQEFPLTEIVRHKVRIRLEIIQDGVCDNGLGNDSLRGSVILRGHGGRRFTVCI